MHIDDFRQVAKQLEPDAWAGGDGLEPFVISLAISAKRIADRLEKITTLYGDGSMGQLNVGAEGNINVSING